MENRRLMDEDNPDSIICHGGNESFWRVKQNINLSNPIRVIWAGEEACDDGGPFREFLFYSMANLYLLSCHFFLDHQTVCFLVAIPMPILKITIFLPWHCYISEKDSIASTQSLRNRYC